MRKSLSITLFLMLSLFLIIPMCMFVACGDDDDDPDPTATPTEVPPTPTPIPPFYYEGFDTYAAGSGLAGQGGWETWGGGTDPAADGTVTDAMSYSAPNSLEMGTGTDIVQTYSGVNAGHWTASAMIYVPANHTGDLFFIMLDTYGSSNHWAIQMTMSGDTGLVESLGGTDTANDPAPTLPLITDQWVEISVDINLDANTFVLYYNGEMLDQNSWTVSGLNEIQAFDLFSNGGSTAYYDDIMIDTAS